MPAPLGPINPKILPGLQLRLILSTAKIEFYNHHLSHAASTYFCSGYQFSNIISLSEKDQVEKIQESFVNFYPKECINPYVTLAAQGSWIITLGGAVVHDSGGYGMLGLGHAPKPS